MAKGWGDVVSCTRTAGRPGTLRVHVVDVLWHSVVNKHGRELLLEVGSQYLDQSWTYRDHKEHQKRLSAAVNLIPTNYNPES